MLYCVWVSHMNAILSAVAISGENQEEQTNERMSNSSEAKKEQKVPAQNEMKLIG